LEIIMQQRSSTLADATVDAARQQVRIDLAAAHRLAHLQGLSEGIFNHLTARVPGADARYYQIPFGLHWSEITASCFLEVSYAGEVLAGEGEAELSGICIHAPMHRLAPHAGAVFHTHMPFASTLTRLEDQTLKPIGQTEAGMVKNIAYDEEYPGPAFIMEEGERLTRILGDKRVLFLANHGVVTTGRTVAEAYDLLYYLERAAQVQVYAMWTGRPLRTLKQPAIDITARNIGGPQYYGKPHWEHHFNALKRMLDRKEPDYKD
jgi:ribulose-5-phosphate 4-epimerase/fuculose-1-phosphate aldolase